MMEPSDRDLRRGIEKVDPDPDEPDAVTVWVAFIEGKHPDEMGTIAEADAVRQCWLIKSDNREPGDLEDMTAEQVEQLDEKIRQAGRP